jgi:HK97 family phage prohead protease
MTRFERRGAVLEVRVAGEGPARRLVGYAATFNTPADIGGQFVETIRAGAFTRSLAAGGDILGLADHDPTRLLARTRSGTLRLSEDRQGLAFELDLPATTLGADMLALASRGDLGGMSFAFRAVDEDWQPQGMTLSGAKRTRELRAVDLVEISVVSAWPAYEGTSVQARQKLFRDETFSPAARLSAVGLTAFMSPAARRRFLETL